MLRRLGLACALAILSQANIPVFAGDGYAAVHFGGILAKHVSVALPNGGKPRVSLEYREDLDPRWFLAELNGNDVSAYFMPQPGTRQVVSLPLREDASNVLVIRGKRRGTAQPDELRRVIILSNSGAYPRTSDQPLDETQRAELEAFLKEAERRGLTLQERSRLRGGFGMQGKEAPHQE